MDTLIYSASPLKTFSGSLILLAFFFLLGGLSILSAIFSRRQKILPRIVQGLAGFILLLVGIGSGIATYNTYQNGEATVLVRVEKLRVVTRNCDNASRTCTDYVAETTDGRKLYDFNLGQDIWEKLAEKSCYQFTYYPAKSLFGEYLQEGEPESLYETTGNISRIEQARCP
jgi:hypothetical protein